MCLWLTSYWIKDENFDNSYLFWHLQKYTPIKEVYLEKKKHSSIRIFSLSYEINIGL